ncbi:MAG: hypothetical protein ACEY3B_02005 [Wolbachia sp.]
MDPGKKNDVMKVAFHPRKCHPSALTTWIQLLCNLMKNVCFSVRQLPLAHQLSYKQNFWIPDWNDTLLNRHTAIHSRYLLAANKRSR